jgi:hypothetical protein
MNRRRHPTAGVGFPFGWNTDCHEKVIEDDSGVGQIPSTGEISQK